MSDNLNPVDLMTVNIGELDTITGNLDAGNIIDTYKFTVPGVSSVPDNGEAIFDVLALFNSVVGAGSPLTVTIGQDQNGNGQFDIGEIIGSSLSVGSGEDILLPEDFIASPFSIYESDNFFRPGETYFAALSSSVPGGEVSYSIDAQLNAAIIGEIATNDDCYSCDANSRYYYDEYTDDLLGQDIRAGIDGLVAGDDVSVTVFTDEFDPVLFLFNVDTGEVIEGAVTTDVISLGGQDYQSSTIEFQIQDGITYGASVETFASNDTGRYVITAAL